MPKMLPEKNRNRRSRSLKSQLRMPYDAQSTLKKQLDALSTEHQAKLEDNNKQAKATQSQLQDQLEAVKAEHEEKLRASQQAAE